MLTAFNAAAAESMPAGPPASADPALQTEWGLRYQHAEGVARDHDRAIKLYCAAARKGYAPAQYWLGWSYANGHGVDRDDGLAAAWFRLAASQGDRPARRMLEFIGDADKAPEPKCILTDGSEYLEALKSVPNPSRKLIRKWVRRLSPDYELNPALVLAVIQVESNFDPKARSHKNAQGLMQLIPATAERFGVKDILDPLDNLKGGMAYLRWLLDYFNGNLTNALAAYNAGEQAVKRHGGVPPYSETRAYVRKVRQVVRNTAPPVSS